MASRQLHRGTIGPRQIINYRQPHPIPQGGIPTSTLIYIIHAAKLTVKIG
jgi:hypothetical protein